MERTLAPAGRRPFMPAPCPSARGATVRSAGDRRMRRRIDATKRPRATSSPRTFSEIPRIPKRSDSSAPAPFAISIMCTKTAKIRQIGDVVLALKFSKAWFETSQTGRSESRSRTWINHSQAWKRQRAPRFRRQRRRRSSGSRR
jgi:hypothetical protein